MSAALTLTWEESVAAADGRASLCLVRDWLARQQPGQRLDYYALERWSGGRCMRSAIAAALAELYASGFLRPAIRRLIDDRAPVELQHVACDDRCPVCRRPDGPDAIFDPLRAATVSDCGATGDRWSRMPNR